MPGKRATFTPPGHLCFLMHYPTISTHMYRSTILHDLRCNAGGASVRLRLGRVRHEAVDGAPRLTVHALNKDE